jgi:hypothetical protein
MEGGVYRGILVAVIIASLALVFIQNSSFLTGHVTGGTEASTYSNVSIQKYLAMSFSSELATGIYYGNVATLPATNINATQNYLGASNATQYYVYVSNDSNTAIDVCIRANTGLSSSAGDIIGLNNETYASNVTTSNITDPSVLNEVPMDYNFTKGAEYIQPGNNSYWRFWLDVPSAQPSGIYNNSVYFRGVQYGFPCGNN